MKKILAKFSFCFARLSILGCVLLSSCAITFDLPCFMQGSWEQYENEESIFFTYRFEFSESGKYRITFQDKNETGLTVNEGTYTYTYYTMNYAQCAGIITLVPDDLITFEKAEYVFTVVLNPETRDGRISMNLTNTQLKEKYDLTYTGIHHISAENPEGGNSEQADGQESNNGE